LGRRHRRHRAVVVMVRRHLTVYHTPNRCWPFWSTGCSIPRPTGPSEKVRKLAANPIFAIIASTKGIDFIIEGTCPRQEPNQRGDVRGEHLCRFGQLTPSQAEHEGKGLGLVACRRIREPDWVWSPNARRGPAISR